MQAPQPPESCPQNQTAEQPYVGWYPPPPYGYYGMPGQFMPGAPMGMMPQYPPMCYGNPQMQPQQAQFQPQQQPVHLLPVPTVPPFYPPTTQQPEPPVQPQSQPQLQQPAAVVQETTPHQQSHIPRLPSQRDTPRADSSGPTSARPSSLRRQRLQSIGAPASTSRSQARSAPPSQKSFDEVPTRVGGLGADLDREECVEARKRREKMMQYAAQVRLPAARSARPTDPRLEEERQKQRKAAESKQARAAEYARSIPKPAQSRSRINSAVNSQQSPTATKVDMAVADASVLAELSAQHDAERDVVSSVAARWLKQPLCPSTTSTAPVEPVMPVAPVVPVAPVAPIAPIAPVAPAAPVARVIPAVPVTTTWRESCPPVSLPNPAPIIPPPNEENVQFPDPVRLRTLPPIQETPNALPDPFEPPSEAPTLPSVSASRDALDLRPISAGITIVSDDDPLGATFSPFTPACPPRTASPVIDAPPNFDDIDGPPPQTGDDLFQSIAF